MRFAPFPRLRSLATQLLCTYAAALLLALGTMAGLLFLSSRQDAGIPSQEQLRKMASLIQANLQFDLAGVPRSDRPLGAEWSWVFSDFAADAKYRVLDRSGRVLVSSNRDATALTSPGQPFDPTLVSFTSSSGDQALFVRTERMIHGAQTYYVQVAATKRFTAFVHALTARLLVSETLRLAFVSMLLVTVAVYFTLRRVLRPLHETSAAAAQIDAHHLSKRLATRNLPTEFLPVVTAFNLTLDRLEKGYLVQRAFLADAAHELKTPLALIRAQIDMGGSTDREVLLEDIDRIARQVNQLLHLAEASETQNYVFESVRLEELAQDVADYLRRLAERHRVYVEIHCAPTTPAVEADRGALFMLIKNLVENAIQHSPAGGTVEVRVGADQLSVSDEGPGITADELPKLFKRFWRGPTRHSEGAGLGLSICAEIAAAHKWDITARSTGQGAQFIVFFGARGAMSVAVA
jgi:two-component system sensor histidine kinase QseC